MSIKVSRSNIERGRGLGKANKALISFQQAALTRRSDFPGECLNNFANACSSVVGMALSLALCLAYCLVC